MARLDAEYAELKKAVENPSATPEEKTAATAKLEAREKHLAPAYQSVALEFADLHDRSGRMKAKANCTPCDWENSRRAIYWSIRRKLNETVSGVGVCDRVLIIAIDAKAVYRQPRLDVSRAKSHPGRVCQHRRQRR